MDFGWLKRIFKKKNLSNTYTSDLTTIDTSFIRVPKLSELSDENKLLVKKYLQEIRPDEYESVLKYSEELLNKSNCEIECFMNNLDEIIKDISSVINEVNEENYFKMLLNKEEIRQSVDEFYKIIDEAKLRLLALDMYIKREEKRKYDLLGIFGKDERIEYLIFKNRLLNERDRLKTTIKIASQHLLATFKALKEEETLLNQMEGYINSSKKFSIECTEYCNEQICKKYAKELMIKKQIIDKDDCIELSNLINMCEENVSIGVNGLLNYSRLVPYFAKEKRKIKKYAYEHRNDYKLLIDEMNALYSKYTTTSTTEWNLEELNQNLNKYDDKIQEYKEVCDKYITDDILNKMRESLWNLSFLNYICDVKIPFDLTHKDYWSYPETKYHFKIAMDLLSKINDKYDISLGMNPIEIIKNGVINENKLEIINSILKDGEFQYLFDILNGNFGIFNLKFDNKNNKDYNLNLYLRRLNNEYYFKKLTWLFHVDEDASLDDIFYIDKFIKSSGWIINEFFKDRYGFSQGMNKYLFQILVYSYLKNLDLQYDDRIIVLPSLVDSYGLGRLLNEKNIHAIYVSTSEQLQLINMQLIDKRCDETSIKYILVREEEFNNIANYDHRTKIIKVPNDTKYSDLSEYLDQELVKEQPKILSKTL